MNRTKELDFIAAEQSRMRAECRRREREIPPDLYAPWQPAELLANAGRRRLAARLLHRGGAFPKVGDQCLEIGCGTLGWFGELISWGISERDIHGIELDPIRLGRAREILPGSDLRNGNAVRLPWPNNSFQLVIASTVLSSILDQEVRRLVAAEAVRVIAPGGALLWYDFAYNNPRNPHVQKVDRAEIRRLFPQLHGEIRPLTLAPPLARLVAPKSWPLAILLEALPLLRTHLMAVLTRR